MLAALRLAYSPPKILCLFSFAPAVRSVPGIRLFSSGESVKIVSQPIALLLHLYFTTAENVHFAIVPGVHEKKLKKY